MKKLLFVILATTVIVSMQYSAIAAEDAQVGKVTVYYFHGSFRCSTCTNMEQYAKEAIEVNFKEALASGNLEFKAVNVEEPDNEHFVRDYQLYTKSLIVSYAKDGKEIKSKNLDKIWEYARNKQKFGEYVTEEIGNFIKETQ